MSLVADDKSTDETSVGALYAYKGHGAPAPGNEERPSDEIPAGTFHTGHSTPAPDSASGV